MSNEPPIRRRAIVRIPSQFIVDWLSNGVIGNKSPDIPKIVGLPVVAGLPFTAVACGIWTNYECDSIDIVVEDDSFDGVPPGVRYPVLATTWDVVRLEKI